MTQKSAPAESRANYDLLRSPSAFLLDGVPTLPHASDLKQFEQWFEREGQAVSDAVDRGGTPWLRMHDTAGRRHDQILFPPEYWKMLRQGYRSGVVWRAFERKTLIPAYAWIYVTAFFDPGLSCPYTVSLATAVPLSKYGDAALQRKFLEPMLRRDDNVWQGATWMTEIRGGSDLGSNVETFARADGDRWRLTGDKYFASNAGAEVAVVAARPEKAPQNVRGLALFLVPREREDGTLNYTIRRLKDKIATRSVPTGEIELRGAEGWMLGPADRGIYHILEVLNVSRVANSVGSVALTQRALADAYAFAQQRVAFGKPIVEHPLLRRQFEDREQTLRACRALAWESVKLLDEVWRQEPPYSERYHLFRLVAHLAKYWTAEFAVQTAKWAMEVHGGLGTLEEYRVERWLREAMILAIWEGTSHRQVLDGMEVMERKRAHHMLMGHLSGLASAYECREHAERIDRHLALPPEQREAGAEGVFRSLAQFAAEALATRPR